MVAAYARATEYSRQTPHCGRSLAGAPAGLEALTPGLCGHGTRDSVRFARRSRRDCAAARGLGLNRSHTPALAVGIGAVAGLRTLTAPAVLAWLLNADGFAWEIRHLL